MDRAYSVGVMPNFSLNCREKWCTVEARGNVLYIEGENSILRDPSKADGVAAICVRAKGSEIDSSVIFHGTGSMTIDGARQEGLPGREGEATWPLFVVSVELVCVSWAFVASLRFRSTAPARS